MGVFHTLYYTQQHVYMSIQIETSSWMAAHKLKLTKRTGHDVTVKWKCSKLLAHNLSLYTFLSTDYSLILTDFIMLQSIAAN